MAKATRKLKVFQTRIGFFDYVVAVPSQAAALRAWGLHQNVFAAGAASAVTDPEIIGLARDQPGVKLRRAIGSSAAFSSEPARPELPDEPPPSKKPPDRRALRDAEHRLSQIKGEQTRAQAAFARRRRGLAAEEAKSAKSFEKRLAEATARVEQEAAVFKKVGGKA